MSWLEDAISGVLKGLDSLGRIRLYKNDGKPLPYAQSPGEVVEHIATVESHLSDSDIHRPGAGQVMLFNNFRIVNSEWNFTEYPDYGTIYMNEGVASLKYFIVPFSGLKVGDEIISYRICGAQHVSAGDENEIQYTLKKINSGTTITMTNIHTPITYNENGFAPPYDREIDLIKVLDTPEEVAAGYQYYLYIGGMTGALPIAWFIWITGVELTLNRK